MENTRRSFLKKVSAAGIGAAGLAMVNYVSVSSERVLDAMSILIMYWRSPVIRS